MIPWDTHPRMCLAQRRVFVYTVYTLVTSPRYLLFAPSPPSALPSDSSDLFRQLSLQPFPAIYKALFSACRGSIYYYYGSSKDKDNTNPSVATDLKCEALAPNR